MDPDVGEEVGQNRDLDNQMENAEQILLLLVVQAS